MTIFVIGFLSLSALADSGSSNSNGYGSNELTFDDVPPKPSLFTFSFRVAGEDTPTLGNEPEASIGGFLTYNFYKQYALGVEFTYDHPFTQFQDYVYNGMNDLAIFLADNEIWRSREMGMSAAIKASVLFPTSPASQQATMKWGLNQNLIMTKTFTDHAKLVYTLATDEYYYQYGIAAINTDGTVVYNIRFDLANRLSFIYDIYNDFHWQLGAAAKTYNDYNNQTYNIYSLSTGLTYDVQQNVSFDIGAKAGKKDSDFDNTWNGPSTSNNFGDAAGLEIWIGTTLKI
jgi:hypothetical protein